MKRVQEEKSAAQEMQEVLTLEAHRAQATARQVLSQLAEERDASGWLPRWIAKELCVLAHSSPSNLRYKAARVAWS